MNYICTAYAIFGGKCKSVIPLEIESAFVEHMAQFGLSYGTQAEYEFRLNIFAENKLKIQEINSNQDSFTVGYNKFSTWTDAEYQRLFSAKVTEEEYKNYFEIDTVNLPDEVNWV
jgi:hypothetical protein